MKRLFLNINIVLAFFLALVAAYCYYLLNEVSLVNGKGWPDLIITILASIFRYIIAFTVVDSAVFLAGLGHKKIKFIFMFIFSFSALAQVLCIKYTGTPLSFFYLQLLLQPGFASNAGLEGGDKIGAIIFLITGLALTCSSYFLIAKMKSYQIIKSA